MFVCFKKPCLLVGFFAFYNPYKHYKTKNKCKNIFTLQFFCFIFVPYKQTKTEIMTQETNKIMNFALLNHRTKVAKLARLVTNRNTYGNPMYAIDVNIWGISEPFSDPENSTIYRSNLYELANDTFVSEDEEIDHTYYSELN